MYLEAFTTFFSELTDTRQSAKITYPLEDILFVTPCCVIAGAEDWSEIRDYADGHLDWFQQHGYLSNGVPVDDTIARTISHIDPEQFKLCFIKWMQAVHECHYDVGNIIGHVLQGIQASCLSDASLAFAVQDVPSEAVAFSLFIARWAEVDYKRGSKLDRAP
ncbi:hypothetical protein GCM10009411_31430 [Shewanella litoralis]|uniref:H repeat-associated protein N-terminal domain-containing protein n=1 Tax=Shewanella litoralis TaxID=2282700 RepID=A0ABQ2RI77_9GAMM|nr:hypothetical protein GCM10009411_31430 [Shewanella litoralis]